MPPRPASIKVRALQWLAQREHSRSELRTKLLRLVAGSASESALADDEREVDTLLEWLAARGYLSDARFIESRLNARQARYGNRRIQQELRHHGVALDAGAEQALSASELERARQVWQKKYGGPADDAAGRLRQVRFLLGRGFSADVVHRIVRNADTD